MIVASLYERRGNESARSFIIGFSLAATVIDAPLQAVLFGSFGRGGFRG
jgi:hypothetical protein